MVTVKVWFRWWSGVDGSLFKVVVCLRWWSAYGGGLLTADDWSRWYMGYGRGTVTDAFRLSFRLANDGVLDVRTLLCPFLLSLLDCVDDDACEQ